MSSKYHPVIGIDLGTTYSAVASYNTFSETAEIIKNALEEDSETTPSVVGLDPLMKKVIVGLSAKRQIVRDENTRPEDTIIEIKREMGAKFINEKHLERFNAKGTDKKIDDPVEVFFANRWLKPQEISAFILMKMKEIAERELGEEIRDVVVTVPAYFKEPQKKATEEAALLAGMYPQQIIPEPTAAAICYGLDQSDAEKKHYLIYDLGGGTFDVTILSVEGKDIVVKATSGDPRLGGGDFDDLLTQWVVKQILAHKSNFESSPINLARIKARAEQAKIALSTFPETTLDLMYLGIDGMPSINITRQIFENEIDTLLKKSLNKVDEAMNISANDAGITRDDIDAIILVGGSSKIPKVRSMLIDYFEKDESFIKDDVNPDTVVARGAAILAYKFKQSPPPFDIAKRSREGLTNVEAGDVVGNVGLITEHSLGVGLADNTVARILDRGSKIPAVAKKDGFKNAGPTDRILVGVYQGEEKHTFDNELIGTLQITGLDPTKGPGEHDFEVTFQLDENGLLTMTVLHLNENRRYEATFEQQTGVGGDKQLAVSREILLELYASATAQSAVHRQQSQPSAPPAQPSAPPSAPPAQPSAPPSAPPAQAAVPPPQSTAPDTPASPAQSAAPPQTNAAPPQPAQPQAADTANPPAQPAAPPQTESTASPTPIEAAVEIPEQFKQTVRRSRKQLEKDFNQQLLDAYNTFISALNAGNPIGEMEELGDILADTFDDVRK